MANGNGASQMKAVGLGVIFAASFSMAGWVVWKAADNSERTTRVEVQVDNQRALLEEMRADIKILLTRK